MPTGFGLRIEPAPGAFPIRVQCDVADAKSVPATGQIGGKNNRERFRFNGRPRSTQSSLNPAELELATDLIAPSVDPWKCSKSE